MKQGLYYLERSMQNSLIQLWSKAKLSSEATGWLLDMKRSLQNELRRVRGKGYLYANFVSNRMEYFEIDNLLFNQVGNAFFSNLAVRGLCYERLYKRPPLVDKVSQYPYYTSYQVIKKNQKLFWRKEKVLARWSYTKLPDLRNISIHAIWAVMKQANIRLMKPMFFNKYGLNLQIMGPTDYKINLTTIAKPLTEGVVAAFHHHNGAEIDATTTYLREKLNLPTQILREMLIDRTTSILGEKTLVMPYHKTIKWYPDLQLIALVNITYKPDETINDFYFKGELFGVKATKNLK